MSDTTGSDDGLYVALSKYQKLPDWSGAGFRFGSDQKNNGQMPVCAAKQSERKIDPPGLVWAVPNDAGFDGLGTK